MNTKLMFSSKTPEWETPQDLFEELDEEFAFSLDVCATKENRKCANYFTEKENGLIQSWGGHRCWMNPPYGKEIGKWVLKAFRAVDNPFDDNDEAQLVVCLLPARTDTRWFHDYIYGKAQIRFLKGRLKFGKSKNSAPFPSMVVIFKNNPFKK